GSRADVMNGLGCKWRPCVKGPGSRASGVSAIHSRLAIRSDGLPGLRIFRNRCPNLIRTIPQMVYPAGRGNVEDIDESCERHGCDALAYGLQYRRRVTRVMRVKGI